MIWFKWISLGPFYIRESSARNYIISCIDDCSRKRSIDVLDVLEEWIMINGKPKKIMHDNGKQFTSNMFKRFLEHNDIRGKI
jgi:transposase InsO family protein